MEITKQDFLGECREIDAQIKDLQQMKVDLQNRWILQEAKFKVGDIVNVLFEGELKPEKLYICKVGLYTNYGTEKHVFKVEYHFKNIKANGDPSLNNFYYHSPIAKIELA